MVGTVETIEGVAAWLTRSRDFIPAKLSKQPNLYTSFPGFNRSGAFRSELIHEGNAFGHIKPPKLKVDSATTRNLYVRELVALYSEEVKELAQKRDLNVIICAPSLLELEAMSFGAERKVRRKKKSDDTSRQSDSFRVDFHDFLKAQVMRNRQPIQIILPATYDESKKRKQKGYLDRDVQLQDEATRAWNFFTALYYKSAGIPWRLVRESTDPTTCFIGISFFHGLTGRKTYASSAQVFNERGEGVIVRGGEARYSLEDNSVHLDREGATELLKKALAAYRHEHHNYPARIVMHKTSKFTPDESEGFLQALSEKEIDDYDLINMDASRTRLFRTSDYPPVRGTFIECDDDLSFLYTRGSVPFYETYEGRYPPRTLKFKKEVGHRPLKQLAKETLSLTKMNWNSTGFDELYPITLRASRQVGSILRYLEDAADEDIKQFYRFYM